MFLDEHKPSRFATLTNGAVHSVKLTNNDKSKTPKEPTLNIKRFTFFIWLLLYLTTVLYIDHTFLINIQVEQFHL